MRKLKAFFLLGAFLWAKIAFADPLSVPIGSDMAILINQETGAILFEKNCHASTFPASITKVATALYVLKLCGPHLDEMIPVKPEAIASITPQAKKQSNYRSPPHWLETDGTHVGLKKGETLTVEHLLYALLLSSANDAANVLAQHFGGTIPAFMHKLNHYLADIGCKNTHFLNPHGLHHPNHVSSAADLALMTKEAMKYPLFRKIVSTVRYKCPQSNLEQERTFVQTNLLLRQGSYFYPKAIGIKTGTTSAAGKTLIAAAQDNGRTLIAVVLGNRDIGGRYEDVIKMFDAAFKQPSMRRRLLEAGPQALTTPIVGAKKRLQTFLPDGLYYDFFPSEDGKVKAIVQWNIPHLPIEPNSIVGTVKVIDEWGKVLTEKPLFSKEKVDPTWIYQFKSFCKLELRGKKAGALLGLLAIILFGFFNHRRRKGARRPFIID